MPLHPPSLFELQLRFAQKMSEHYHVSFAESIFLFTNLYVRTQGLSDHKAAEITNPKWQKIMENLPEKLDDQTRYFYAKYQEYEVLPRPSQTQNQFGCFSYVYLPEKNMFILDFSNNDKEGNLARERIEYRKKELQEMFQSIHNLQKKNATISITSWLLNIDAFTRLFPIEVKNFATPSKIQTAQERTHWGQFVDRHENLRTEAAATLLQNVEVFRPSVNDYFPLQCLEVELPQEIFNHI